MGYFSKRFGGKYQMGPMSDRRYFIDRDPAHFRLILNYLRDGGVEYPRDYTLLKQLLIEAEFYGVDSLAKELGKLFHKKEVEFHKKEVDSKADIIQCLQEIKYAIYHIDPK